MSGRLYFAARYQPAAGSEYEIFRGHCGYAEYRLTRAPEDYTVGAILKLTEGTLAPVACMDCDSGCTRVHACMTRPMWQELDRLIDDFLESRTLADLLTEDKKHED